MSVLDRIARTRHALSARSWPVGAGAITSAESVHGHDTSEYAPDYEYGNYLVTSNDVYAVVSSRARLVTAAKLRFYRGSGAEKTERADAPAAKLYRFVNPHWTAERLERMDEIAMCLWGHTAWAIEPGGRGEPDQIWWLKPSRLKPVPDQTGYLRGFIYDSPVGVEIPFRPDEIVWFRYPNPLDEFSPLSPLAAARLAADTAKAMAQTNRALFTNGLMAGGIVVPGTDKVVFSREQADDLERQFASRMKGSDKAHRWMVLRFEAKMQGLNVTPKDAEFVEGMNLTFRQVCRAFGLQSGLQGDAANNTLANVTAYERLEWSRTLVPDLNLRASEIREQYLPRFRGAPDHCEYDFSQIPALQESASEAWAREAQAIDRGAITINEWRKTKGMPPVEWGDKPYMPVNKAPLGDDGQLDLPDPPVQPNAKKAPDDEVNPANKPVTPRAIELGDFDHHAARRLLASVPLSLNGAKW